MDNDRLVFMTVDDMRRVCGVAPLIELTEVEWKIAEILVECAKNRTTITFGKLGKMVGVGRRQVGKHAGAVGKRCVELGLPALSVLVVYSRNGKCGSGFHKVYDEIGATMEWSVEEEKQRVYDLPHEEWDRLFDGKSVRLPIVGDYVESEGDKKPRQVNVYERSAKLRRKCLEKNGCRCGICGANLGEIYGKEFADVIEVHHKTPVSGGSRKSTADDLIPVCPNCHRILHAQGGGEVYTVDEVKDFIEKNKKSV